jgi:hypothetical protein
LRKAQALAPAANRSYGDRMLPCQLNVLLLHRGSRTFALTKGVFHILRADFDFQHLAVARQVKSKASVFLRCAPWPECKSAGR